MISVEMTTQDKLTYSEQITDYDVEQSSTEDLEKVLMVAAADADDARNLETLEHSVEQPNETDPDIQTENSNDNNSVHNTSLKRKHEDNSDEISSKVHKKDATSSVGYANVVASHYNQLEEKGVEERCKSRIVYLRNFHNWIKSMLINEYLTKVKSNKKHNSSLRVLDMGCGKGGDLLKWRKGNITHLICSDIAEVSLEQCKQRYNDMKRKNGDNLYSIEYIPRDCSRMRLREKYSDPSMKLDIVSCQFAFHYSFESRQQAECMLKNAAECLQPGGFFIGTIPDANDLVARAKRANSNVFGNDVYKVVFDCDVKNEKPPLFGAKYNFYLDGVVNCPEFLVHFGKLIELAKKHGLKFVKKEKFLDFFNRNKNEGHKLLSSMRCLEFYPPLQDASLVGTSEGDYDHAEEFIEKNNAFRQGSQLGTLSKSEWEASSLYLTFAFEKVKPTSWNADGTACYNI